MSIGFHFDDIELAFFGLDDQLYDSTPIGGFHEDYDDTDTNDDSCIGGMHGEFRERECNDDT